MLNSKSCKREPVIFDSRKTQMKEQDNSSELSSYKDIEEYDFLLYAKNILKESRDDKFKIRSRIEFEKLSEEKVCDKTTIRLKFKNEFILQGNFALQETVESIYNFLFDHLNLDLIKDSNSVIIQSGIPSKKLSKKKTIHEESLYPNSLLYVDFDYHCNDLFFFKADSLSNHLI